MINQLFQIFSTREIAAFVWLCVFSAFLLYKKDIRPSIFNVIKALGNKFIITGILSLIIYTFLIVLLLYIVSYWDIAMMKDTFFWLSFTAVGILFSLSKAIDTLFFSNLIKDNIKIIIILEFILNLYTFPLLIELLLFPIILFISILQAFTDNDIEKKKLNSCLSIALSLIVLCMLFFSIYKSIVNYECFFSISTLKYFSLPIILTLLSLPYFYGIVLYMRYESFIVVVKQTHRNENSSGVKDFIKATKKRANININTLGRIWKYQASFNASKDNAFDYVKKISQRPKYIIGDAAKLKVFNDIQRVIIFLSNNGIGKLDEWHKSYGGDDCYLSMTNYYQFGSDDITQIPNTLAYYLTGEEMYIKQLELVLDIGYQQDKTEALMKFTDIIKLTFDSLMIPIPNDLTESVISDGNYLKKCDTHTITIKYEKFEKIELYQLSIITK